MKEFMKAVHKEAWVDRIHGVTAFLILLIYALVGTSNLGEIRPESGFRTGTSTLLKVVFWIMIFSMRFCFSYLRIKRRSGFRAGVILGGGYDSLGSIARSGVLSEGYYLSILMKMLPYTGILAAAFGISGLFYRDFSDYMIAGLCVVIPIGILGIVTFCTNLRRGTRGIHHIVTAPLGAVRAIFGFLEFGLLISVGSALGLMVYSGISGVLNRDLSNMEAVRTFTLEERVLPVVLIVALILAAEVYMIAEVKIKKRILALSVLALFMAMGIGLFCEYNDHVTVTDNEITLTESGNTQQIEVEDIERFLVYESGTCLEAVLTDRRTVVLIGENTMNGRNVETKDNAYFVRLWTETFLNAGIPQVMEEE